MNAPQVFVLVLNYNGRLDTLECLRSVYASAYRPLRVLLIDNGSSDGCVAEARTLWPELDILENGKNYGYAEGNNRGIARALAQGAEYVLVLNNDTKLEPNALQKLVEAGENTPQAGILAPKILRYDHPRVIDSCGTDMDWFRLRPKLGHCGEEDRSPWEGALESPVFPGSALFFKRSFLESAGTFDAGFFLIHEDADLCYRGLKKGFKNRLVPEAVVYHKVSRTLSKSPFLSEYYSTRNFLYLAERHANALQRAKVSMGLNALFFKKALFFIFAGSHERKRTAGFIRGTADYFLRRQGPGPA